MKKLVVVLCVVAVAFAFTSCKKDNKSSCRCSGTYTYQNMTYPVPPVGTVNVGDFTGTQCETYKWENWEIYLPSSEYVDNFKYTCKSE
jgi:hypothetical protein